jgi:hypothetical protein
MGMKKAKMIELLNAGTSPTSLGFEPMADDGYNQYWVRRQGVCIIRLNCALGQWDADVSGWE